jgi:dihydropteroate synthase
MILVALGANLPGAYASPRAALEDAMRRMEAVGLVITARSRVYLTAPVPISDQPWYHNAVVAIRTDLPPHDLLGVLRSIESAMGRVRSVPNAARVIDLDVIAYNDDIINTPDLVIPHPRMHERAFVLKPLRDVAPDWVHPHLKKPVNALIAALPPREWFAQKPLYLMGIVNATPDSFSDGGAYDPVAHGKRLIDEGADIIDIGGESTRPGAQTVSVEEECRRVMPVISALKDHFLSIDTRNAATMSAALYAGAHMLNDVSALTHDAAAMDVAATCDAPVCLMHMQGTPQTMQQNPVYKDVVAEVYEYLQSRIQACMAAGIEKSRLIADPGFGFGKTYEHNVALLENFTAFQGLGVTLMAGVSRKRFIGRMMDGASEDARLEGSIAAARKLTEQGARILRVHDVAPTALAVNLTPGRA